MLQQLFAKYNGITVSTPTEEEWSGMHWELQTLVKNTGGLVDLKLKYVNLIQFNSARIDEKLNLLQKKGFAKQLQEIYYPQFWWIHYPDANKNDYPPHQTNSVANLTYECLNSSEIDFEKRERIRLEKFQDFKNRFANMQKTFQDYDPSLFNSLIQENSALWQMAVSYLGKYYQPTFLPTFRQYKESLIVTKMPLLWSYKQCTNFNRTALINMLEAAVTSCNPITDKYLRASREEKIKMLTTGNIFFVIKSMREHEVFELAILKQFKKGNTAELEDELFEKCKLSNESWYHQELHETLNWKLFKELEEKNLLLVMQHLSFLKQEDLQDTEFNRQIKNYMNDKAEQILEINLNSQVLQRLSQETNSQSGSDVAFSFSEDMVKCAICLQSKYEDDEESQIQTDRIKYLGCPTCNQVICEGKCWDQYKANNLQQRNFLKYNPITKKFENCFTEILHCPSRCKTNLMSFNFVHLQMRAQIIENESQRDIQKKLDQLNEKREIKKAEKLNQKDLLRIEKLQKSKPLIFKLPPNTQRCFQIKSYIIPITKLLDGYKRNSAQFEDPLSGFSDLCDEVSYLENTDNDQRYPFRTSSHMQVISYEEKDEESDSNDEAQINSRQRKRQKQRESEEAWQPKNFRR